MLVAQMHMCQPIVSQNYELIQLLVCHASMSAYMEYQVEMSSLHLDMCPNVAQAYPHLPHQAFHTSKCSTTHAQ